MPWFRKKKGKIEPVSDKDRVVRTENVFVRCDECGAHLYKKELEENLQVCVHCNFHFRIGAYDRLEKLFDDAYCEELDSEVVSTDPLDFVDSKPYVNRISQAQRATGLPEAVITARGRVGGHRVFAGAMDMNFIGGSIGSAVGEKLPPLVARAIGERGAVIIFCASGGARMQEGTLSLMQMAKISAALAALEERHLPFISVLTDHTTGSESSHYAMLGDLIVAEPKALIGFAGPRVIEQTIRQKLPKDFQRSEFLLDHGMIDEIVDRRQMRPFLIKSLDFMMNPNISEKSQVSGLKFQVSQAT